MANSTLLSQALTDRLYSQANIRETRFIAAQDTARAFGQQVAEVLTSYDFCCDEANCQILADGTPVQCAMLLTDKETGKRLSVICKIDDCDDHLWFIPNMTDARYEAGVYIAAVKDRIEASRTKRGLN